MGSRVLGAPPGQPDTLRRGQPSSPAGPPPPPQRQGPCPERSPRAAREAMGWALSFLDPEGPILPAQPQHIWRDPCSEPHWPHLLVGPTLPTQAVHVPMGVCAHSPAPCPHVSPCPHGHSPGPPPPSLRALTPEGADGEGKVLCRKSLRGPGGKGQWGAGSCPADVLSGTSLPRGAPLWGNLEPHIRCLHGEAGWAGLPVSSVTAEPRHPSREGPGFLGAFLPRCDSVQCPVALNGLQFCRT